MDLWTDPAGVTALLARWTERLAGGPQAGTSDSPPLARVMGVGSQQQQLPPIQEGTPTIAHPFSEEEYRKVIAGLKNNKAAGRDDVLVEQLK